MSDAPSNKSEIRQLIANIFLERLEFHTVQADLTDGPEREKHLANIAFFQKTRACRAAREAAETRH